MQIQIFFAVTPAAIGISGLMGSICTRMEDHRTTVHRSIFAAEKLPESWKKALKLFSWFRIRRRKMECEQQHVCIDLTPDFNADDH